MTDIQKTDSFNHSDPHALLSDLDELYLIAQLLVNRNEDVNVLVERAIERRFRGSTLPAGDLLRSVLTPEQMQSTSNLIKARQIETDLAHIVPRLIARTSPSRRVDIIQAFLGRQSNGVERSSFMHRIRRSLESHGDASSADAVTEAQVSRSIQNYVDSTFTPVSPGLRGSLESRYASASAPESVLHSHTAAPRKRPVLFRLAAGFLLILAASAIGTWIAKPSRLPVAPEGRSDILTQIDTYSPDGSLVFQGSDRSQIERLIEERSGQRVALPFLSGGSITGLSLESVTPDLTIPTVHYSLNDEDIPVFVLDYRTIQLVSESLDFDSAVLNQISSSVGLDIHVLDSKSRLVFRHRDDIFITFAAENPQDFRRLFRFDQ